MTGSHKLKKRNLYLNKLIAFQDTEPVKIVTGIRRCGKSSLLKLMIAHLKETGITDEQIIEMNFESHAFRKMTDDIFYDYVKEHVHPQKKMYLFSSARKRLVFATVPSLSAFSPDPRLPAMHKRETNKRRPLVC